ncbi:MAG: DUF2752 domain-containing protein [Clostridia bacterium]|nr:DUF2752 domain-containing protein [Clostridia bacterium]
MKSEKKILLKRFIIYNAILAAFTISGLTVLYFLSKGGYSVCLFKTLTRLYCPGCGGTRSLIELSHLHVLKSLMINPIPIVLIAYALFFEISYLQTIITKGNGFVNTKLFKRLSSVLSIALAVVIISFFVIRNVLLVLYHIDPVGDFYPAASGG